MGDTDASRRSATSGAAPRRIRLGALAILGASALAMALCDDGGDLGHADRRFTLGALALAGGSILTRHRAGLTPEPRLHQRLAALSLALAAALGPLGLALAAYRGERDAGLLFALAGAILTLRLPRPVRPGAARSS